MSRAGLFLLLALAGCSHYAFARGPFTVEGGSPEEQAQAVAIAEAARDLYPDGALRWAMTIRLSPDIDRLCGWKLPEPEGVLHYAGCVANGINVLWPHPKLAPGADLTRSALAHELAHVAFPMCSEGQADAGALLIVQEYRRQVVTSGPTARQESSGSGRDSEARPEPASSRGLDSPPDPWRYRGT